MIADPNVKTLIKILIGAAWIDGQIQAEEREYLHRIVKEKGLETEPEIQPLLYEFRPIKPEECYGWVKEYLGDRPSSEACQQLIEALSGLIYSDGNVANEEAKLLTDIQLVDVVNDDTSSHDSGVMKVIRDLYKRWVAKLEA
jgi:uncharacterized tellurite resistance protein B-like protein